MRWAKIKDGIVDVISFDPDPEGWVEVPDNVFAGFTANKDGTFTAPPPLPPPVPASISFPQLLYGLVTIGFITEAEGEAWLAGTLPPAIEQMIAQLPAEVRFLAKARAIRPSVVERNDQFMAMFTQAAAKTPAEVDDFFRQFGQV